MKPQPLGRRQAAFTRFGIMTIHLTQHFQHVATFVREVLRNLYKLPASVREKIEADVRAVAADPIIVDRLNVTAQILNIGGAAAFTEAIDAQRAQLVEVAKVLGIASAR